MSAVQERVDVVPLTLPQANACVEAWHRHHAALPGGFSWFACGAVVSGAIVGAAIAGRPTNRNNDDGQSVEVLRLASNGTANVCSALLGSCARAAKAIGARRIFTYTLVTESGTSLRAAGWRLECEDTGRSWWDHAGTRTPAVSRPHQAVSKRRWGLEWRGHIAVRLPAQAKSPTLDLFGGAR